MNPNPVTTERDALVSWPSTVFADDRGLRVAREVARWHIGDADWADMLIDAYLNPERAQETLTADKRS